MKYLYVTWDAPQASYLETLFLPIFERLAASGISFDVLQFTWNAGERAATAAEACRRAGIGYDAVKVSRGWGGAGPLLSAFMGASHINRQLLRTRADGVLARSTMPALATLRASRTAKFPFVFDADGLPLDERVDFAGRNPCGLEQRILRDIETQMVLRSKVVLVRTPAAQRILEARAGAGCDPGKFFVVSNGRDPKLFQPGDAEARQTVRAELGVADDVLLLGYAGSVGPQYRFSEMVRLLRLVQELRPGSRLLLLTPALDAARQLLETAGARSSDVIVRSVSPPVVPKWLAACDIGLALRTSTFSMQAVAPIKLGEYLLCGVPVVGTPGIGDTGPAVKAGVFRPVANNDPQALDAAARWVAAMTPAGRDGMRDMALGIGRRHFSLEAAVASYAAALTSF